MCVVKGWKGQLYQPCYAAFPSSTSATLKMAGAGNDLKPNTDRFILHKKLNAFPSLIMHCLRDNFTNYMKDMITLEALQMFLFLLFFRFIIVRGSFSPLNHPSIHFQYLLIPALRVTGTPQPDQPYHL